MRLWKALVGFGLACGPFWVVACSDTDSRIGALDEPVHGAACSVPGEKQRAQGDCNDCTCADGAWACTDVACGAAGSSGSSGSSCMYEGIEYRDGETFQCDCNTCFCEGGQIGGTLIGCAECQAGETKIADDGCNECDCAEGRWACTDMACNPGPSSCTYEGASYANGEMFRCGDCGICFCVEGQVGNTQAACELGESGSSCTYDGTQYPHGEIFDCDCNICWCDDGQIGGNIRACDTGNTGQCTYLGVPYELGEAFPAADGCNTCSCEEGGVACTLMECDPCTLPAAEGPCDAIYERFYFDAELGECRPFTYGGCQGNANNFETLAQCEQTCPGG
jgi:hypothetical protein